MMIFRALGVGGEGVAVLQWSSRGGASSSLTSLAGINIDMIRSSQSQMVKKKVNSEPVEVRKGRRWVRGSFSTPWQSEATPVLVLEKVFSEKELNDDAVNFIVDFHSHVMIETCVGMQGHPGRHQTEVHGRFWRGCHEKILVAQLSYLGDLFIFFVLFFFLLTLSSNLFRSIRRSLCGEQKLRTCQLART